MTYANPEALVSGEWLATHLDSPDIRIIDATWYHPSAGRKGCDDYNREHIPGAVFFDIDEIADTSHCLPHMLPDPTSFAVKVGRLGLGDKDRLVVYDRSGGSAAAARVWWTFRVFGHDSISLLNGGWSGWLREARSVSHDPSATDVRPFTSHLRQHLVRDIGQMKANLGSRREQVLDARPRARFAGQGKEPWQHTKVGHIPGSLNLPWDDLLDPESRMFLPAGELRKRFEDAGLDLSLPTVTTCGSGVTASVLAFGLFLLGDADVAVYDGSWAEWGQADDTPAVTD